jgi:hypothetical protein
VTTHMSVLGVTGPVTTRMSGWGVLGGLGGGGLDSHCQFSGLNGS